MPQVDLSELVRLIYESVSDAKVWNSFVQIFSESVQANCSALVIHDLNDKKASLATHYGLDPVAQRNYEEYYAGKNVWVQSRPDLLRPGLVLRMEATVPSADLVKTEYYNDYLRPNDFFYSFGGTILKEGQQAAYLTALRPQRFGEFSDREIQLLERLMPHLQTAVRLRGKILHLENRARAFADALDHIPGGVLILSKDSVVLEMNRAALTMVDSRDGLNLVQGELRASASNHNKRLRLLVHEAAVTPDGHCANGGGVLRIPRPSGKRDFLLLVAPLLSSTSGLSAKEATAVVYVTDTEEELPVNSRVLSQMFGLTAAESRLALELIHGGNVTHAAKQLGITVQTARTHLKRILSKTETKRQSEFLRLVLNSPAVRNVRPQPL